MLGSAELQEVCEPDCPIERRARLQHALLGKFAYFRTIGRTTGRQWSQVVLGQHPVSEAVPGALQIHPFTSKEVASSNPCNNQTLFMLEISRHFQFVSFFSPLKHDRHVFGSACFRWRSDGQFTQAASLAHRQHFAGPVAM